MGLITLLTTATTTGAGDAATWYGGFGTFTVNLLGGGRVDLEHSPDGTNYEKTPIEGSTGICSHSTGDGALNFRLNGPVKIRANIITASTTGVTAWVQ